MRLLIVSQWFPYPPINGARQRVFHLLRGLSKRHQIHFLSFTQQPNDLEHTREIAELCEEVTLVPGKEYQPTKLNAIRALFSTKPRSSIDRWNPEMERLIKDRISKYSFDAMIAFTTLMAEYVTCCKMPKILDNDNVDSEYFARLFDLADNPLSKFRRKLTWVKVAHHERRLVSAFDATVAVSEEDKQSLECLFPAMRNRGAIHVVANGVDLGLLDYKHSEVDSNCVVSTGALTYRANLDSALFFCDQILPSIRNLVGDTRFVVTGGYEGVDVAPLMAAGATLTGFLRDVRPAIARSAALVVPTRIGGGTRLKILEAMALGTPVVSTTIGAMGLGLKHQETAMIADHPTEFAECTVQLMRDTELRQRISENGRRYVAANFGWERSVDAMNKVLELATRR